jgi:hypothetical protein
MEKAAIADAADADHLDRDVLELEAVEEPAAVFPQGLPVPSDDGRRVGRYAPQHTLLRQDGDRVPDRFERVVDAGWNISRKELNK